MAYSLLTGPTGLLGSYLLRDALDAGRHIAVLIRPTRSESVRGRVESMLARLEKVGGRVLPRPVVIEGDLTQPGLGIDTASVRWIARHCDAVIHSAANLAWEGDPPGEPWLSNVQGMHEMLELCRTTGIRQFHHISTAYVCGQREGCVLETELDEGQQFNNDYERSKTAAEKILRSAKHLDSLTVYRPSIIVGDSRTGFTTAFPRSVPDSQAGAYAGQPGPVGLDGGRYPRAPAGHEGAPSARTSCRSIGSRRQSPRWWAGRSAMEQPITW